MNYNPDLDYNKCYVAGFAAHNYGTIKSCMSNVNINYTNISDKLIFAGFCAYNTGNITQSLALNEVIANISQTQIYTFSYNYDGIAYNNYVDASKFSAGPNNFATAQQLNEREFYINTLKFNPTIWNFETGKLPFIKGETAVAVPEINCEIGSLGNPIPINNVTEFLAMDLSKSYYLTTNIDLAGITFDPLGCSANGVQAFSGNFNGNNYIISNFSQTTNPNYDYSGLFAKITGCVENLHIQNCNIEVIKDSGDYGTFAAELDYGRIVNCSVTGIINYRPNTQNILPTIIGGLVAKSTGIIRLCNSNVKIKIEKEQMWEMYIGGFIGSVDYSIIQNCYSTGDISFSGTSNNSIALTVGGFVGQIEYNNTFTNCYASGNIFAENTKANVSVGAFGGGIKSSSNKYSSCAAFGNISLYKPSSYSKVSRFIVGVTKNLENIFVYEGQIITNLADNTVIDLSNEYSATLEQCNDSNFWESKGWSNEIWNLNNIDTENKVLPVFKI